jgi:pimeloyl-ACP methyl ester carboxylesterase
VTASPVAPGPWSASPAPAAGGEYLLDAWQRTILTLDVLRERGNQSLEHARSGNPPVLVFDYDTVLDARAFPKPANYSLLRIRPGSDNPPTDPTKRPFIVVDPRAGHGPGIGGFKIDSEIGIALRQGHPCYFVMFSPQPVAGQTIESVCAAEIAFVRKVNELHPKAERPFMIGNCQGGWALMMVAALAPQEIGPILLAGSPVSFWAGVVGENPMRYLGGLLGGSWTASLLGDLGAGKFDGAYLVNNFEGLDPANTYWTKLYNLYSNVDTERERFLQFERWWGGHFFMNREEMDWIVQNLFVGNKLSSGEIESFDRQHRVDLRNIRSPIVVFASWGDNITPPQQALDWIPDLYRSVHDIQLNEQTIVYCIHERAGHLGLFVSAGVAKRETAELASALDLIDTLPPGLYEAIIQDTRPDMPGLEHIQGRYLIQFAPRTIEDILALDDGRRDEQAFEVVERVSRINQGLYNQFWSPLIKALSNEATAWGWRAMNPVRIEHTSFSDLNPWMLWVKAMAESVRADRRPVSPDNPFLAVEQKFSSFIEQALEAYRIAREHFQERVFKMIYESPWLALALGIDPGADRRGEQAVTTWERDELARLKRQEVEASIEQGTLVDAWARLLLYLRPQGDAADERPFNMVRRLVADMKPESIPSLVALKHALKRQALVLALDEDRAIAALPKIEPDKELLRRGLEAARLVLSVRGELTPHQNERYRRAELLVGLGEVPLQ